MTLGTRGILWILGAALLLAGVLLRRKPVEVAVYARADPSTVYWTGRPFWRA